MVIGYVDCVLYPSIPVLRGCTTSGEQWIFFVYSANDSGGGRVACSDEFSLGQQLEGLPLILGLLTDWVCPSFPGSLSDGLTNCSRWTMPLHMIKSSSRTNNDGYRVILCPVLLLCHMLKIK